MARGGRREGAGRPKGQRSAATKDQIGTITEMAQSFAVDAITALHTITMDTDAPHSARVSAANAILDRGYGKPMPAPDPEGGNNEVASALREIAHRLPG